MPIEGFDYEQFSNNLANDAEQVLNQPNNAAPETLTDQDKKNIVNTVRSLTKMAGEALNNDANIKFNSEQAYFIVQCVGEWSFHKSIDFINGRIPVQFRSTILNAIVRNMFQTMKLSIIKNIPTDDIIKIAEGNVNNTYREELQKLVKRGAITQEHCDSALKMSNLENMAQQNEAQASIDRVQNLNENTATQGDRKILKQAALAIILKRLPKDKADLILTSLDPSDVKHVVNYMSMSGIEDKIDPAVILKSLEEIKRVLPQSDNVNVEKVLKQYYRVLKDCPEGIVNKIAKNERENIKGFILDRRFPAVTTFSPYVMQALANIIEDKINDN